MDIFKTLTEAFLDTKNTDNKLTLIGEKNVLSFSYEELQQSAKKYAGIFEANGLKKGDRAVISAHELSVFFSAFWGVILCGAAAIPVIPPISGYTNADSPELQRLKHIAEIAEPAFIVADETTASQIQSAFTGMTAVLPLSQVTAERCPPLTELPETESEQTEHFTEDGWFRTGDLAVIHNGGLVITGRESDIFIVNGVNYSIGSMEYQLRYALPDRYSECLIKMRAVSDANTGADMLYIFAEQKTTDEPQELISIFRHTAEECFGFSFPHVYAVPSGSIPHTGIGKIDSKVLVRNAQEGKYSAVAENKQINAAEFTDEENLILFIWAEALDLNKQELTPEDDFFLIGGDSARVPQVLQRINAAFSADINAAQFVRYSTVHGLLEFLHNGEETTDIGTKDDTEEIILL